MKIVIVDDSLAMRKILRRTLQQLDLSAETLEVDGVTSALDAADTFQFDCAIVDESLAGDSGVGAIDQLRTKRPNSQYILLSSSLTMGVQTVGSTDNVFVLPKPYTSDSLRDAITSVIPSDQPARSSDHPASSVGGPIPDDMFDDE